MKLAIFSSRFADGNQRTFMKFCMGTDFKRTQKLCLKYFCTNKHMATIRSSEVLADKFSVLGILFSGSYT